MKKLSLLLMISFMGMMSVGGWAATSLSSKKSSGDSAQREAYTSIIKGTNQNELTASIMKNYQGTPQEKKCLMQAIQCKEPPRSEPQKTSSNKKGPAASSDKSCGTQYQSCMAKK